MSYGMTSDYEKRFHDYVKTKVHPEDLISLGLHDRLREEFREMNMRNSEVPMTEWERNNAVHGGGWTQPFTPTVIPKVPRPVDSGYIQMPTSSDVLKSSNPKDSVGIAKVPMSTVPAQVIAEIGLGMMEGALKYGRHNYRVSGVRSSVYYDATFRHLMAWYEGQDLDSDSGLSHITKALASLVVLRDAMLNNKLTDDRPPPMLDQGWVSKLNEKAKALLDKYPNPKKAFTK